MASKSLKSIPLAWAALILIILFIALTFTMRTFWWAYIDCFFAFLMAFMHLMAVYMGRRLPAVGKQLDSMSFLMGVLMIISFIGEYIAFQCI